LIPGKILAVALIAAIGCRARIDLPVCPPGDTLMGAPPPNGQEVWCQKIVNGKPLKDGRFVVYADNGGKLIEGDYRDGVQEGEWTTWYENGPKSAVDHYHDGLQEGLYTSWYANGQKSIEGYYRAGKRVGVWTRWDPSGLNRKQEKYEDGRMAR
jgi:antitoxin component YwqK of YwqJK toxin-antitoxin module